MEELFVDVTLATSDRQIIRAHRVLLSAGSGYLERVLATNPSDHPTVVLSNIRYKELKLLVDFMYSGEISVDQQQFPLLLEAAKNLRIRGLYEDSDDSLDENESEVESKVEAGTPELTVTPSRAPDTAVPARELEVGMGRKRSHSEASEEEEQPIQPPPVLETLQQQENAAKLLKQMYGPINGVSNAVWMMDTAEQNDKQSKSDSSKKEPVKEKSPSDVPNLLSFAKQPPPNLIKSEHKQAPNKPMMNSSSLNDQFLQAMQLCTNPYLNTMAAMQKPLDLLSPSFNGSFTGMSQFKPSLSPNSKSGFLNSAPVRRYKQYSEDSLQAALKEIMGGQSINRSSMKHNIPARTLRDWMKRLNIKSVFTHHSHNKERSSSQDGTEGESNASESPEPRQSIELASPVFGASNAIFNSPQNESVFPGMKINSVKDEDEIDDDEPRTLRIDEGPIANITQIAQEAN